MASENVRSPCPFEALFDLDDSVEIVSPLLNNACPENDMFSRETLDIPDKCYEMFQVLELLPSAIVKVCEIENVNLAASYLRQYILIQHTHDFFHCILCSVALPKFVEVIENTEVRMLPFGCFCEQDQYTEARHRNRRHFILVYPKGRFEKEIWKQVTIPKEDEPENNYNWRWLYPIKTVEKLMDTIGSLSQREGCNEEDHIPEAKKKTKKR